MKRRKRVLVIVCLVWLAVVQPVILLSNQEVVFIPPTPKVHIKTAWTKNDSRELAKEYAWAGFGWKGREWGCIKELWWRESRWDFRADNPKSTAYGLSQLLGEKSTSPQVQVLKGYRYIEQRFTTPCKALGFHNRHGYY